MQHFNIIRKNNVKKTFRVAQVMSDFDVKLEHSNENFIGDIDLPENWNIGLIYGGSGTGKTTIVNELFRDNIITSFNWNDDSVLDNMPKDISTNVVDRQVAKTACIAINKAIKNTNKKFIAVSCHKDIIEWLQPDWLFDTDEMKQVFQLAHDLKKNLQLEVVGENNGINLGSIII